MAETDTPAATGTQQGTIIALHRLGCVVAADGVRYECKRKKDEDLCVGDDVHFERAVDGRGHIRERLPRRSWFARGVDGGRRTKVVAANADLLVIVVSTALPPLQPALIDRFLVLAGVGHMQSIVCLNKMDLPGADDAATALHLYNDVGVPLLPTTATEGEGIAAVRDAIGAKRALFCGHSGVGKSSVINALVGDHERLRTGEISAATGKGIHTTTWIDWIPLDGDTVVIDTPGIRLLSLAMLDRAELQAGFPEFAAYADQCHFRDCVHMEETGCAVHAAALRRNFNPTRYASYRSLMNNP